MLCAVCLRINDPDREAITIANGHALCGVHFQRLNMWQSSSHGTPALEWLVQIMYQPDPPPPNPPARR